MPASINRRRFLERVGSMEAVTAAAQGQAGSVSIIAGPDDPVANTPPARWAVKALDDALTARGVAVHQHARIDQAAVGDLCILAAGPASAQALAILRGSGIATPSTPESLVLGEGRVDGRRIVLAAGHDTRGLVYALLELGDRVDHAPDPFAALSLSKAVNEKPANPVRRIARLVCSDVEDKAWFNDREMWPRYFTMLAAQRFNRFQLSLGIGYDFLRQVTDAYFLFA